jgi:hypothetical protein
MPPKKRKLSGLSGLDLEIAYNSPLKLEGYPCLRRVRGGRTRRACSRTLRAADRHDARSLGVENGGTMNRLSTSSLSTVYDHGPLDQVEDQVFWRYGREVQFQGSHRDNFFPCTKREFVSSFTVVAKSRY